MKIFLVFFGKTGLNNFNDWYVSCYAYFDIFVPLSHYMQNRSNTISLGDTVICINAGYLPGNDPKAALPPIKEKAKYIVQGTKTCTCGKVLYDIGIPAKTGRRNCSGCGKETFNNTVWWISGDRLEKQRNQITEYITLECAGASSMTRTLLPESYSYDEIMNHLHKNSLKKHN